MAGCGHSSEAAPRAAGGRVVSVWPGTWTPAESCPCRQPGGGGGVGRAPSHERRTPVLACLTRTGVGERARRVTAARGGWARKTGGARVVGHVADARADTGRVGTSCELVHWARPVTATAAARHPWSRPTPSFNPALFSSPLFPHAPRVEKSKNLAMKISDDSYENGTSILFGLFWKETLFGEGRSVHKQWFSRSPAHPPSLAPPTPPTFTLSPPPPHLRPLSPSPFLSLPPPFCGGPQATGATADARRLASAAEPSAGRSAATPSAATATAGWSDAAVQSRRQAKGGRVAWPHPYGGGTRGGDHGLVTAKRRTAGYPTGEPSAKLRLRRHSPASPPP